MDSTVTGFTITLCSGVLSHVSRCSSVQSAVCQAGQLCQPGSTFTSIRRGILCGGGGSRCISLSVIRTSPFVMVLKWN